MNCPNCGKEGQKVAIETAKHQLKTGNKGIGENSYYLCMTPNCDVAYYSSETAFDKSELKEP